MTCSRFWPRLLLCFSVLLLLHCSNDTATAPPPVAEDTAEVPEDSKDPPADAASDSAQFDSVGDAQAEDSLSEDSVGEDAIGEDTQIPVDTQGDTAVEDSADSATDTLEEDSADTNSPPDALVDECGDGTADCDPNATCNDLPEGYECVCNEGYAGDGVTCEPALAAVTVTPEEPTELDTIECIVQDAAGGSLSVVAYQWTVSDLVVDGQGSPTLVGTYFNKGDTVTCAVQVEGSAEWMPASNTVTVQNTLPRVDTVTVASDKGAGGTSFDCSYTGWFDPDPADAEEVNYAWWILDASGTTALPGETSATLNLPGLSPSSPVVCVVTPKNGSELGEAVASDPNGFRAVARVKKTTLHKVCVLGAPNDLIEIGLESGPSFIDVFLTAAYEPETGRHCTTFSIAPPNDEDAGWYEMVFHLSGPAGDFYVTQPLLVLLNVGYAIWSPADDTDLAGEALRLLIEETGRKAQVIDDPQAYGDDTALLDGFVITLGAGEAVHTLTAAQAAWLWHYTRNDGRTYLEGGPFWTQTGPGAFRALFHVRGTMDHSPLTGPLVGAGVEDGLSFDVQAGADFNSSLGHLIPIQAAVPGARAIEQDTSVSMASVVAYDAAVDPSAVVLTYRTVAAARPIALLVEKEQGTKVALVDKTLTFLEEGYPQCKDAPDCEDLNDCTIEQCEEEICGYLPIAGCVICDDDRDCQANEACIPSNQECQAIPGSLHEPFNFQPVAINSSKENTLYVETITVLPPEGTTGTPPVLDVHFKLQLLHADSGELTIELSHAGITVALQQGQLIGEAGDQYVTYDLGTESVEALAQFNGLPMTGDWTVTIIDVQPNFNAGTLLGWQLFIDADPAQVVACTTDEDCADENECTVNVCHITEGVGVCAVSTKDCTDWAAPGVPNICTEQECKPETGCVYEEKACPGKGCDMGVCQPATALCGLAPDPDCVLDEPLECTVHSDCGADEYCAEEESICLPIPGAHYHASGIFPLAIPDANLTGLSNTIAVPVTPTTEKPMLLYVKLHIKHPFRSDLKVWLTRDGGEGIVLFDPEGTDVSDDVDAVYPFDELVDSVAFKEITVASGHGAWTLHTSDDNPGDAGSLLGWSLHLEIKPPGCSTDEDCPSDLCQLSVCNLDIEQCETETIPVDDGLWCNGPEKCVGTVGSVPGTPPIQTDNIGCTIDECDDDNDAMVHTPSGALCDDNNECTTDICDLSEKGCVHTPHNDPCDDGLLCTVSDVCDEGRCLGSSNGDLPPECLCVTNDDCPVEANKCLPQYACIENVCQVVEGSEVVCPAGSNTECVANTCDPDTGFCSYKAVEEGVVCDDDSLCTVGDHCDGQGICAGEGVVCSDGLFCNGEESCDLATGGCQPGPPPVWSDGVDCTEDACNEDLDIIQHVPNDALCEDANVCSADICTAEGCVFEPAEGPCDDGEFCTANDLCADGICSGSPGMCPCVTAADCPDDGNLCNGLLECVEGYCHIQENSIVTCDASLDAPCQKNTCEPLTGACNLLHMPAGMYCDDGSQCTYNDLCNASGNCAGIAINCDDEIDCNGLETCDPKTGCRPPLVAPDIDDGKACTVEKCNAWSGAVISTPKDSLCNDANPCTDDVCGGGPPEDGGCVFLPNTNACDDGDVCSVGDECGGAACVPGDVSPLCEGCTADADCPAYQDGNPCNGEMVCVDSLCQVVPGSVIECDTSGDTGCEMTACDTGTGACSTTTLLPGMLCDDGNACTVLDQCDMQGVCEGLPTPCGDGNPCNGEELCDPETGVCSAGSQPTEDDGIECTVEVCDPDAGGIVHVPNHAICDDGNVCTTNTCDPAEGCQSEHNSLFCDDSNDCTLQDQCADGGCTGTPTAGCPCQVDSDCPDDGDLCNGVMVCNNFLCELDTASIVTCDVSSDSECLKTKCLPETGLCEKAPVVYGMPCNDGSVCTLDDYCDAIGECVATQSVECDDGLFCNGPEWCHPQDGCVTSAKVDLNDKVACTQDYCDEDSDTVVHAPNDASCATQNACTSGQCDPVQGCLVVNVEGACEDGDSCTLGDVCSEGVCTPGTPSAEPVCTGCQSDAECPQDGNKCNGSMICHNGACKLDPDSLVICDTQADTLCEKAQCNPETGGCPLVPTPAGLACDDGSACTYLDACNGEGNCEGIALVCDDGLYCNGVETCDSATGTCVPGSHDPSDAFDCTIDLCDEPSKSDVHLPNDALCEDGQLCSGTRICEPGQGCVVETPVDCEDDNPCRQNLCDADANEGAGGCDFSAEEDSCAGTACTGGHAYSANDRVCGRDDACVGGLFGAVGTCTAICASCSQSLNPDLELPIPSLGCTVVELPVTPTGSRVQDVHVKVDIAHPDVSALTLTLTSPDGFSVPLLAQPPFQLQDLSNTWGTQVQSGQPPAFSTCKFKGVKPQGTWLLEVCNDDLFGGTLERVNLYVKPTPTCQKSVQCLSGVCNQGYCESNPGNHCENAVAVPVNEGTFTMTGTTLCSRNTLSGVCGGEEAADTVIRFTLTDYTTVTISAEADFDHLLHYRPAHVEEETCSDTVSLQCMNGQAGSGVETLSETFGPGDHYLIVDGVGTAEGSYALTFDFAPAKGPGDACSASSECVHGYCCQEAHCGAGVCCNVSEDPDCDIVTTAEDNCPAIPNADQQDTDEDLAGDVCDSCPLDAKDDEDEDGMCADVDPCPVDPKNDEDEDGLCADADACPLDPENDADDDGLCDDVDPCLDDPINDPDGDDLCALIDNCPLEFNEGQEDLDEDEQGDVCDQDIDGDAFNNDADCAPTDPTINPAAFEVCDGEDNDCNLLADDQICDDENVCTDDQCDPEGGSCQHSANTLSCDDGDACTTGDVCGGEVCVAGEQTVCQDDNPCTDNSCNSVSGQCQVANNTAECSDDNACTTGESCQAGACAGGVVTTCADETPCTDDSCDPNTGDCVNAANALSCTDGSVCTVDDQCSGGACVPGGELPCDDGQACTTDSCDPSGGCQQEALPNGTPCDEGKTCDAGFCTGIALNVKAHPLAAGHYFSCAVRSDDSLACWGRNSVGQLGQGLSQLAHSTVPMDVSTLFKQVKAVHAHTNTACALTGDGSAYCWGGNDYGALGDGTTEPSDSPVLVSGELTFVSLTTGFHHVCGITDLGQAYCWGHGAYGQLGGGNKDDSTTPIPVNGGLTWTQLSAGRTHTCGITGSGALYCWGSNGADQLGDGSDTTQTEPVLVATVSNVVDVAAGYQHTCALDGNEEVYCWGEAGKHQLGLGSMADQKLPVLVPGLSGVKDVIVAYSNTCAIKHDGALLCWGENAQYSLGLGTSGVKPTPTPLALTDVASLGLGTYHGCARTNAGALYCWGHNTFGSLGLGTVTQSKEPVLVTSLTAYGDCAACDDQDPCTADECPPEGCVNTPEPDGTPCAVGKACVAGVCEAEVSLGSSIATGYYSSYVVRDDDSLACFGRNHVGQLGVGTIDEFPHSAPEDVTALGKVFSTVDSYGYSVCALRSDETVACWGENDEGEVGLGVGEDESEPVVLDGVSDVQKIGVGLRFGCALKSDASLMCWGKTLGSAVTLPETLSVMSPAADMAVGGHHLCVLAPGGRVECVGNNAYGQLGDGTNNLRTTPITVAPGTAGLTQARQVVAGGDFTCALLLDGQVACWGRNTKGQLGTGNTTGQYVPTLAVGVYDAVKLFANHQSVCALLNGGELMCWGANDSNLALVGTSTSYKTTPTLVTELSDVEEMALGYRSSCARTKDGAVWCWGLNSYGQLSDGTTATQKLPAMIQGLSAYGACPACDDNDPCTLDSCDPSECQYAAMPDGTHCGVDRVCQAGDCVDSTPLPYTLSTGYYNACVRRDDGSLACFGRNQAGQLGIGTADDERHTTPEDVLALGKSVESVVMKNYHACSINQDQTVSCWGYNDYGQLGDGTQTANPQPTLVEGVSEVQQLAVGFRHACVLNLSGELSCWGANVNKQLALSVTGGTYSATAITAPGVLTQVTAGAYHSCGITPGGSVSCWGYNKDGELGFGKSGSSYSTPIPVALGTAEIDNFKQVVAGSEHTCALGVEGEVACWGRNHRGQLGIGSTTTKPWPVLVPGLSEIQRLFAAYDSTCALTLDHQLICWGDNSEQLLAVGSSAYKTSPTLVDSLSDVSEMAIGYRSSCARDTQGTVFCWGYNGYGQLSDGTTIKNPSPTPVLGLSPYGYCPSCDDQDPCTVDTCEPVTCEHTPVPDGTPCGVHQQCSNGACLDVSEHEARISVGYFHTCALRDDGTTRCWGRNQAGQLGDGTVDTSLVPLTPQGVPTARAVHAQSYLSCVETTEGGVSCWGLNNYGQAGQGTTDEVFTPADVLLTQDVAQLSTGDRQHCTVQTTGGVRCWGSNVNGQLGQGETSGVSPAVDVDLAASYVHVSSGFYHVCALDAGGKVFCWGYNNKGQLGVGDGSNRMQPAPTLPGTAGLIRAKQLATGGSHTCALLLDGRVACWGANDRGQLGDSSTSNRLFPVLAEGVTNAKRVIAAYDSSCAVLEDNTALCWGDNPSQILGVGSTAAYRSTPQAVNVMVNFHTLAMGYRHACSYTNDGQFHCWGENAYGQLGSGDTTKSTLPVVVNGL